MLKIWPITFILTFLAVRPAKAQSFVQNDLILNVNIGAPHLFKSVAKTLVKRDAFKNNFEGQVQLSSIKGTNPIALRTEYAVNEFLGIGLNFSFWNIRFNVIDHYNVQNQNIGTLNDSSDVYKIRISSRSLGIRPNLHFPIKNHQHDIYIGVGLGFTSNTLSIGFSSTDAGRFAKTLHKNLKSNLSLPGGFYFAPTIGYRAYFSPFTGFNFELGYEKGALIQAGLVFKFNPDKAVRQKQKND